jgi:predicted nucleic acid-binding protein
MLEEFHYERDPDEEIYINLAIVINANALLANSYQVV